MNTRHLASVRGFATPLILVFFVALIASGVVALVVRQRSKSAAPQTVRETTPTISDSTKSDKENMEETGTIPAQWQSAFSIPLGGASFGYPPDASITENADGIRVHYMGEAQKKSGHTQTELFDGYTFSVEKTQETGTLQEVATIERSNAETNCHSGQGAVSALKEVPFGTKTAYEFTVTGCYVDHTEKVVMHNDVSYRVIQTYVGETAQQLVYKAITEQILSTLRFTQP